MTTKIKRDCTIVQFRARADIVGDVGARERLKLRITMFKGTYLGTTGDGHDVIAAFNSEFEARRWMRRYFEDAMGELIAVNDATI